MATPVVPEEQPDAAPAADAPGPGRSILNRMGGPSDLKAGLAGYRDPDEVKRIIYEASKGSKYYNDQVRRDREVEAKGERLKARLAEERLSATGREDEAVDRVLEQLEEKRDLSRVIALIDADAFYANVHQRDDPSLAGTPFGVGGGMLTTASYEARKYGCRSAMPLFIARKLCPQLVSLKMEPKLYVEASKQMMAIYETYGPISPASLDEAYVDLTDYCKRESVSPSEAISRLRDEVFQKTGLTVSAGVSPNKALSKICADVNKPNGQFVIDPTREGCMAFIKDVRLRRCFGIGRVTESLLNAIGFETVGDLYTKRADLYLVRNHLGQTAIFRWLLSLYLGIGSNTVVRAKRGDRKTYGVEKTFNPIDNRDELDEILRKVAKSLAKDVQRAEFAGRTITLKIKHANFETVTRAFTPGKNLYMCTFKEIYRHGLQLLHKEMDDRKAAITRGEKVKGGTAFVLKARLLGLRLSNLRDEREEKKGNKLDGFVRRTDAKGKAKVEDLSDTDDSDIERDEWDVTDSEDVSSRSQLEKLTRDALAGEDQGDDDALLREAEEEDAEPDRPLPSARWQCPEEEYIIAEGLEAATGVAAMKDKADVEEGDKTIQNTSGCEELILDDTDDDDSVETPRPEPELVKRTSASREVSSGPAKKPKRSPPLHDSSMRKTTKKDKARDKKAKSPVVVGRSKNSKASRS
ncbi:hypothetical protein JCM10212_006820 [Sporobolomyces blumeae]